MMLVRQIFVVNKDFHLLPKENASVFLEGFCDAVWLSLGSHVSCLSQIELLTAECNWLATLRDHCSQLMMAGIRMDLEWLQETWARQHDLLGCDVVVVPNSTWFCWR